MVATKDIKFQPSEAKLAVELSHRVVRLATKLVPTNCKLTEL